jgi:hypothetical protein
MPTTLSPVDVCNVALSMIGAQAIVSLLDAANPSSRQCNQNFNLVYQAAAREGRWNCLLKPQALTAVPQTPITGSTTITATAWAPNTNYTAGQYVTYGNPAYYYAVMTTYQSSNNFLNDLTTGALVQTDLPTSGQSFGGSDGSIYPSSWAYSYQLPSDCLLVGILNDNEIWAGTATGSVSSGGVATDSGDWEIMGNLLYTDDSTAVIKYVSNVPDTTQWDPLFTQTVATGLASAVATPLRQDGGKLELQLAQEFERRIKKSRMRNANERLNRQFNPIATSNFVAARYGGPNG